MIILLGFASTIFRHYKLVAALILRYFNLHPVKFSILRFLQLLTENIVIPESDAYSSSNYGNNATYLIAVSFIASTSRFYNGS